MDVAAEFRTAGVLRRGRFLLKSGKRSDFYIDMKKAWGSPRLLRAVARTVASRLPRRTTCIAASGYGGLPLGTAVSLAAGLPLVLVREKRKEHGRHSRLDGYVPGIRDRVALVDDVYSSGTGMRLMERILGRTGARIIGRLVVVDRSGRRRHGIRSLLTAERLTE